MVSLMKYMSLKKVMQSFLRSINLGQPAHVAPDSEELVVMPLEKRKRLLQKARRNDEIIRKLCVLLKCQPDQLIKKLTQLLEDNKREVE